MVIVIFITEDIINYNVIWYEWILMVMIHDGKNYGNDSCQFLAC